MKRIQIKWLKMYNVIISVILGILGFTVLSCSKKEDTSGPHPMYGVSSAEYIIQGTVTDNQAKHTTEPEKITIYNNEKNTDKMA